MSAKPHTSKTFQSCLHERTKKILALIPKERAPSEADDSSDPENELETCFYPPSNFSSPAPSIPSSLERLNISDSPDEDPSEINVQPNDDLDPVDEPTPLTPILQTVFPNHSQEPNYSNLPSISSLPSLPTPKNRKRRLRGPSIVTKKRPKQIQKFSLTYKWKRSAFLYKAEIQDTLAAENLPEARSPSEYFSMFFTESIIANIVNETNAYSVQKKGRSINLTQDEFRDFLAIHILMGVVSLPSYLDYWSNKFRYDKIASIMPLKRYETIRQNLHFADNNFENSDRYYKIRPLLEGIRKNCLAQENVVGERTFSIDEMMIPYKGHKAGKRRQYMKDKPTKWGFKIYVRAGTSGIIYDFLPYGGDDTFRYHTFTDEEKTLGFGAKVVFALCQTIAKKPVTVCFDNFFASPELVYILREHYGIFSLGTIRSNRLRGAEDRLLSEKDLKKKNRGAFSQIVCNKNKLSVLRWYDNKAATLISSYTDAKPITKIKRYCKDTKKKINVDYPNIVKEYNKNMGGVDLADMLVALYRTPFRSKRWYMALFAQVIDISVNNAWILYRKYKSTDTKCMRLKDFRYEIQRELLSANRSVDYQKTEVSTVKHPCKPRPPNSTRYDGVSHFPSVKVEGRCMNCNKKTTVFCLKCDTRLCFVTGKIPRNCFLSFHVK